MTTTIDRDPGVVSEAARLLGPAFEVIENNPELVDDPMGRLRERARYARDAVNNGLNPNEVFDFLEDGSRDDLDEVSRQSLALRGIENPTDEQVQETRDQLIETIASNLGATLHNPEADDSQIEEEQPEVRGFKKWAKNLLGGFVDMPKAFKKARAAYSRKAELARQLDRFDPENFTDEEERANYERTVEMHEKAEQNYKDRRTGVLGASAITGAAFGLVNSALAVTQKGRGFDTDVAIWGAGVTSFWAGVGVSSGAGALWGRKRHDSEAVRNEFIEQFDQEIAEYHDAQPEDHNFDEDEDYQELVKRRQSLEPQRLRDKFSTKYAEMGVLVTNGVERTVGIIARTKAWATEKGFLAKERVFDWENVPEDTKSNYDDVSEQIEDWGNADDFDPSNSDYIALVEAHERDLQRIKDEYSEEAGKEKLTRRGMIATGVGIVGLAAIAGAGMYLARYGFSMPGSKGGNGQEAVPTTGGGTGTRDTVSTSVPTTGGGSSTTTTAATSTTVPTTGGAGRGIAPEGYTPTTAQYAQYDALDTPTKALVDNQMTPAITKYTTITNPGASRAEVHAFVERAMRAAAKAEELAESTN